MRRRLVILSSVVCLAVVSGCSRVVAYVAGSPPEGDRSLGITYYVGGAGPIGHVGEFDVPNGLADAGYDGHVEVFSWQGWTHAGDQINISRNREKGAELAAEIRRYRRYHPTQPIDIIALSAGTGVATFALEYLPESISADNVVFLGCSLSSQYDLTRALKRVRGGLYVLYSEYDRILNNVVWYTGTVDRSSAADGVAGLEGFRLPRPLSEDARTQYDKLHNVSYRAEFADYGYGGGHTDSTRREFIREYVSAVLLGDPDKLTGVRGRLERERVYRRSPETTQPASQPATGSKKEPSLRL